MKHQPVEDFGKEEIVCEDHVRGHRIVRVSIPGGYNLALYINTTHYPYDSKCLDEKWDEKEWVLIDKPTYIGFDQIEIATLYATALSIITQRYSQLLVNGFSFKEGIVHYKTR